MIEDKLSVIARVLDDWHVGGIKKAGEELGVKVDLVEVDDLNDLEQSINNLGKVVLYRSSGLDIGVGRATFLQLVGKKRKVINEAIYKTPWVANKFYQQKVVERVPAVKGVKSYRFSGWEEWKKGMDKGWLEFPFILKASLGAEGEQVYMIESKEQMEQISGGWRKYVFQNYIANSGDYRVFILGGRVIGMIKRVAAEGEFRNNVSQGGEVFKVEDKEVWKDVARVAAKASSLFGLQMCGVDVVYDQDDQVYRFLEVNTAPQWQGLEKATGVKVEKEVVEYAKSLMERDEKQLSELVEEYGESSYKFMFPKQFHYASRRYLWQKGKENKKRVEDLQKEYFKTEEGVGGKLRKLWEETGSTSSSLLAKKIREPFLSKYPRLRAVNRLLFRGLFAKVVYGNDLREEIFELISKEELLEIRERLIEDEEAVKVLSTIAVNFLYNVNYVLEKDLRVDPEWLLGLAEEIDEDESGEWLRLKIYLLTHTVIGESMYYSQSVEKRKEECVRVVQTLEEIIEKKFFEVSLDNKFEFLVCCRLCGYQSRLEGEIRGEAERSLSDLGNYLVDRLNDKRSSLGDNLYLSEHRNVLFLMAINKPYWGKLD